MFKERRNTNQTGTAIHTADKLQRQKQGKESEYMGLKYTYANHIEDTHGQHKKYNVVVDRITTLERSMKTLEPDLDLVTVQFC